MIFFLDNTILAVRKNIVFLTEIINFSTCGKTINFVIDKIGFDSPECWFLLMPRESLFRDKIGFDNTKTNDFQMATNYFSACGKYASTIAKINFHWQEYV